MNYQQNNKLIVKYKEVCICWASLRSIFMKNVYHNILMLTVIILDLYIWITGSVISSLIAFCLGMAIFLSFVSKYMKLD